MKTVEIKLYEFSELDLLKQQEVLQKYMYVNLDSEWWYCVKYEMKENGVEIEEFDIYRKHIEITVDDYETTAENLIENQLMEFVHLSKEFLDNKQDIYARYSCLEDDNDEEMWQLNAEEEEMETEYHKSICELILVNLTNEYDYQISDEAIIDAIEANEWMFTENGERYDY